MSGMHPPDPSKLFGKIDSNSDGSIDRTEASTFDAKMKELTGQSRDVDQMFTNLDTDGNDKISLDEFKAGAPQPPDGGIYGPNGMMGAGGPPPMGGGRGGGMSSLMRSSGSEDGSTTPTDPNDTNNDGKVDIQDFIDSLTNQQTNWLQAYAKNLSAQGGTESFSITV